MTAQPSADWDPRNPEVLSDQRRAYDELRERCPVAHSDIMNWSLFRHADVMEALNAPDTFINSSRHHAIPNAMNGSEHTQHREILAHHFAEKRMTAFESTCREIALDVLGSVDQAGVIDAVADIAEPISLRTMCAFLGWPQDSWTRVRAWIHGNQRATFKRDREASHQLADEYAAIVSSALEDHRRRGITDDVTGRLMSTDVNGYHWTDEDIIDTLRNWIAGHGTVIATIGIVVAHLAEDQDLQRHLRSHPEAIASAIDEIPRTDGPLVANSRTTAKEVTIGGRAIPQGERISLMWIAANRDPQTFKDADEIQLDRDQQGNLLYGAGIHYCLGAPLARLEIRIAIESLLANTTGISLGSDEPAIRETYPGNGFLALPINLH